MLLCKQSINWLQHHYHQREINQYRQHMWNTLKTIILSPLDWLLWKQLIQQTSLLNMAVVWAWSALYAQLLLRLPVAHSPLSRTEVYNKVSESKIDPHTSLTNLMFEMRSWFQRSVKTVRRKQNKMNIYSSINAAPLLWCPTIEAWMFRVFLVPKGH